MTVKGKAKPSRISPDVYSKFLQHVELKNVRMTSAEIRRVAEPGPGAQLGYEARATKRTYQEMEDGFAATLNYLVRMRETTADSLVGEIKVAVTAEYSSDEPMNDEIFEVFGELNLPLNVFPYIREFVHSATTRMGFPGLILPTVKRR